MTGNGSKATNKVLLSEDVDLSKLSFGAMLKPKNPTGAKIFPVMYDGKTLKLQTPMMRIPFGLARANFSATEESAQGPYVLQLSFDTVEQNPELSKLYDVLNRIDESFIEAAKNNSAAWFGKDVPIDVIKHNFKSSVKKPVVGGRNPLMKVKIPVEYNAVTGGNSPRLSVFVDKKPVGIEELKPQCKVVGIIELKHGWIAGGSSIGLTWHLLQVKISQPAATDVLPDYAFVEKDNKA